LEARFIPPLIPPKQDDTMLPIPSRSSSRLPLIFFPVVPSMVLAHRSASSEATMARLSAAVTTDENSGHGVGPISEAKPSRYAGLGTPEGMGPMTGPRFGAIPVALTR